MKGIIKWYNKNRNFGFILSSDKAEYFVHASQINFEPVFLKHEHVSFDKVLTEKGWVATNVKLLPTKEPGKAEGPKDEDLEEQIKRFNQFNGRGTTRKKRRL